MGTTTLSRSSTPAAASNGFRSSKPPRLSPAGRRRPAVLVAGLVLVAVGAAVAVSAALSAGAKHDVLAISRSVPAGRMLTAGDLRTVRVSADSSLATVPAADEASVVGQRTRVDLVANSLLNPGALGGAAVPGVGQALLGVAFKAGQLPARPLARGDHAELIATPATAGTNQGSSSSGSSPTVVAVTVDAESAAASDGTTVVDLVLPADAAPSVAAQAANGQLVLVLLARDGS